VGYVGSFTEGHVKLKLSAAQLKNTCSCICPLSCDAIPPHLFCGLLRVSIYCRLKAQWLLQIPLLVFMFDYHYGDYFPTQNLSVGFVVYEIWGSSDSALKITVFRDFSFGARKFVPMHGMKACEEVHFSSILNTASGCRRCMTLGVLKDIHTCFGRTCFLPSTLRYETVLWPEISEYFTRPYGFVSHC
jgi:hypothetical protein